MLVINAFKVSLLGGLGGTRIIIEASMALVSPERPASCPARCR